MSKEAIAVIPARGGSQRVPRKNLKRLCGESLIARAVRIAASATTISKVYVDTDDAEIAAAAVDAGAAVPFLRETATGSATPVSQSTARFIERLVDSGETVDTVVQMMANCPFRTKSDINSAVGVWNGLNNGCHSLISCFQPLFSNSSWMKVLDQTKILRNAEIIESSGLVHEGVLVLPTGSIWVTDAQRIIATRDFWAGKVYGFEVSWLSGIDIDLPDELKVAEMLAVGADRRDIDDETQC